MGLCVVYFDQCSGAAPLITGQNQITDKNLNISTSKTLKHLQRSYIVSNSINVKSLLWFEMGNFTS